MTNDNLRFIFKNDKEKIIEKLKYYGIKKLPYLLVESGKEKIRAYSGGLTTDELININRELGIELIGLYLLHNYEDNLRLSFDAVQVLKNEITKNIIEVSDKQAEEFMKGRDILLMKEDEERLKQNNETRGFKVIKSNGDIIGIGKLVEGRIANYMPKERRLR